MIGMGDYEDMRVAVDVPDADSFALDRENYWKNIAYFETREEAIRFCQERFGADEEGRISLITNL